MTIARKLWIAFGMLILVLVVFGLTTGISIRSTERDIREIVQRDGPAAAASYEMEINVVEIGDSVLSYLNTGERRYLEKAAADREEFRRFEARYNELATLEREREVLARLDTLYSRYEGLSKTLPDDRDARQGRLKGALEDLRRVDDLVDEAERTTSDPEKARQLENMETEAAELTAMLGILQADTSDSLEGSGSESAGEFRSALEQFRALDLAPQEERLARQLEQTFDGTSEEVEQVVALNASMRTDERQFTNLQRQMDNVLDGEMQVLTRDRLQKTEASAAQSVTNTQRGMLLVFLVGMLLAGGSAESIGRSISRSVDRLREGAEKIGRGETEHRIELNTTDELGTLGAAFNDMLDKRREASAELKRLGEQNELILSSAGEGIFGLDSEGKVRFANTAAMSMLGYGAEELVGRHQHALIHHSRPDGAPYRVKECPIYATLRDGERHHSGDEEAFWTKDGVSFAVRYLSTPILEDGEITGAVVTFSDITEHKQAENELRESERRFSTLLSNAPAMVYRCMNEPGWPMQFVSDYALELTGYPTRAFLSDEIQYEDLILEEHRQRIWVGAQEALGSRERFHFEYPIRHRDGTIRYVEETGQGIYDEAGNLLALEGLINDVTEREQTQKELQKSEARNRAVVDTATDAIITTTDDGLISSFNPAAERIFGYAAEEIVGQPLRTLMPERFRQPHESGFRRYLSGGEAHVVDKGPVELAGLRKDGGEFPLELSLGEMREEGDLLFTGIVRDITDRKLSEERMRADERRFRQLFEQSADALVVHDSEGRIVDCNSQAHRSLGYTREEMLTLTISDFATNLLSRDEEASKKEGTLWQRAMSGDTGVSTIAHIGKHIRKDGTSFPVEVRVSPIDYDGGRMIFASARDITERKRYERELQKATEAAQEVSRAKSEFLANMSHEIRTPMNGVIGMTELLLDTRLSEEQREYAETVRRSGDNLLTIINEILDFSKIEAGKVSVESIDFDLITTVEDTASLLAERAHGKGLELASAVDPEVPTALRGDPNRIRQVLINLLGNAIKFTEEGEVALRVEAAEKDAKRVVRFSVTDTGIGMSEDQQNRLFQAFTQADATTTRKYGGTGLGLAISKQLVELMGGEIGVRSEPGVGSTFYFELPMEKSAGGTLPVQAPRGDRDLRDLRALIVDDNATNRRILDKQLSSWQMHTTSVENASRALEELRSAAAGGAPYDLAVLDMMMPGMDGLELARQIKADPAIAATHLVILTSAGKRGDARDSQEASKIGIEAYLTKPVRQSALYDALVTVAGGSRPAVPEKAPVSRHSTKEGKSGGGARVLLVEDNAVNQRVAMVMLEKLGYQVEVASDGLEALEALSSKCYSAVLMDVQMPNMDGYEATAEIRRRESEASVSENNGKPASGKATNGEHFNDRTPIIAMTANAMAGDREKVLAAGMDDYLSKPVNSGALDELLEHWVAPLAQASADVEAVDTPDSSDEAGMVLDLAVLEGLRELQEEGEPDIVAELAQMFVEDASSRLVSLREAVAKGDASGVERTAHTLKGSSGNMGARGMQEVSAELQKIGTSGDLSGANELLGRLEKEFGRLIPALTAFVEI